MPRSSTMRAPLLKALAKLSEFRCSTTTRRLRRPPAWRRWSCMGTRGLRCTWRSTSAPKSNASARDHTAAGRDREGPREARQREFRRACARRRGGSGEAARCRVHGNSGSVARSSGTIGAVDLNARATSPTGHRSAARRSAGPLPTSCAGATRAWCSPPRGVICRSRLRTAAALVERAGFEAVKPGGRDTAAVRVRAQALLHRTSPSGRC